MFHLRRARLPLLVGLGLLAGVAVLVVTWAVDTRLHDDEVTLNLTLAGRRIRGMNQAELSAAVHDTALRYAVATIEVQAPGGSFRAGTTELGLTVDEARTVAAAMEAGKHGGPPRRILRWATSFAKAEPLAVAVNVDQAAVARVVAERDPTREDPVEPSFEAVDGRLVVVSGRPGQGVNPQDLAEEVARVDLRRQPAVIEMPRHEVPPRFGDADAQRLADHVERVATAGFEVNAAGESVTLPADAVRRWARVRPSPDALVLDVDGEQVGSELPSLLGDLGTAPVDAGFTVSGGKVAITPSKSGTACCAPEAVDAIRAALTNTTTPVTTVQVGLRSVPPRRTEEAARALGIVEPVGTFTTNHPAGEPRVKNIHRMADLVKGTVIMPGQTFSINATVGRRTTENGFVDAPVIGPENRFASDVGGGVSQFATTLLNAAFFAGLDIPEYRAHGLYISRYPYGREATLSYPGPDLKIRNSTSHGVLIWPTYTGSSITVTLYSTKILEADQTGQEKTERGPCTSVTTFRTRHYLADDRTVVDRFGALYAPEEGVTCT